MPVMQRLAASLCGLLLAGCSVLDALQEAKPYDYRCPHNLRFTARLYRDMATLDGLTGHAVLAREATDADTDVKKIPYRPGDEGAPAEPLHYADASVRARFGLGIQGRLVRLDYANIPEPIYCTRVAEPGTPLTPPRAVRYDGPRPPPPPPDPDAPVRTNIRTTDAPMGPG